MRIKREVHHALSTFVKRVVVAVVVVDEAKVEYQKPPLAHAGFFALGRYKSKFFRLSPDGSCNRQESGGAPLFFMPEYAPESGKKAFEHL